MRGHGLPIDRLASSREQRRERSARDMPPYPILRKLIKTFGMDGMAREELKRRRR
jgi:hypothetical protein